MAEKPVTQFGKREAAYTARTSNPTKRSHHVALLLAGTVAVGGSAYALMPNENCEPNRPGMAAPSNAGCSQRGTSSSSGGHGSSGSGYSSRSSFFSGDSSSSRSPAGASPSESGSGGVTRGGFGSFAHAFTSHFSGGG
jgi:hypothetical protein